jgi:hypothetical protein
MMNIAAGEKMMDGSELMKIYLPPVVRKRI